MNQVDYKSIFEAIKSNDLILFASKIKGNENLSFGRFPILSLCYLYNAKKIITYYEKQLCKITQYKVTIEYFEIYKMFRNFAGRCLRLYTKENSIVSPLEMLAILRKDTLLKQKYNTFEKNEEILKNLQTIYFIFKQKIDMDEHKIKISTAKLTFAEKRKFKVAFSLTLVFVILMSSLYAILGFTFGFGTNIKAFKISNETLLIKALNSNGNYTLENDLTLNKLPSNLKFSGKLNGNNYTLYINTLPSESFIKENNGILKNLNIVYTNLEKEIDKSLSLFVGTNNGTINKVNISCNSLKLQCNKSFNNDIFVNAFANINNGKILNCGLNLNANIVGNLDGECFSSGFAGKNYNLIENCVFGTTSSMQTSEVDVSGIASFNEKNAQIKACKNYASISQTSILNSWSPNVAGIVLTNYGEVNNSHNYGDLTVISTNEQATAEGFAFLGGIVATNYGVVAKCLNKGSLTATTKKIMVYCGGITAHSIYYVENEILNMPSILYCGANSAINVTTESDTAFAFVGGISGYLYGEIRNCYSLSTFANGFDKAKYFVGNCIGSSYLQYDFLQNVICIDASGNFMLKQDNTYFQIGSLINNGSIVAAGVDTSNGEIKNSSLEEIVSKEIYFDE